jgi:DNA-binding PadR family transcriptional regulator
VPRNRPPSAQAINVLRALAAAPARWRYGYDLATEVHLKSGSLYPILVRLADRGLLETSWEPGQGSRPPRHLYRLSRSGREYVATLAAARSDQTTARPPYRMLLHQNPARRSTRGGSFPLSLPIGRTR